eukprot:TRINITY_DN35765_c0_g1_i1.p1 TRINITY_DN35765_c0_g1~~TRINITY_DN35765_c0_g1_i1.p1  ORF type:complete len:435 (+),score=100.28 TRINITY_DN35765_c0_g1_i1:46-1305(+)
MAAATGCPSSGVCIRLILLMVGDAPPWFPMTAESARAGWPQLGIVVPHTGSFPALADAPHVQPHRFSEAAIVTRIAERTGAPRALVEAKLLRDRKGLSDVKPVLGHVFDDLLGSATHWGWLDWDVVFGALAGAVAPMLRSSCDAVVVGGALTGVQVAGQILVVKRTAELVVAYSKLKDWARKWAFPARPSAFDEHGFFPALLAAGAKVCFAPLLFSPSDRRLLGQHFAFFWDAGRVWRCAFRSPVHHPKFEAIRSDVSYLGIDGVRSAVALMVQDPHRFANKRTRPAVRGKHLPCLWHGHHPPFFCSPQTQGVVFTARASNASSGYEVTVEEAPWVEADRGVVSRLGAVLGRAAATFPHLSAAGSLQVCHEGAAYHCGMQTAHPGFPSKPCPGGVWMMQPAYGRGRKQGSVWIEQACGG